MEALISHLLSQTSVIREEQIRQGSALGQLLDGQKHLAEALHSSGKGSSAGVPKLLLLLKPLMGASVKHVLGILTISYALKGGDLMTALAGVAEFLKVVSPLL